MFIYKKTVKTTTPDYEIQSETWTDDIPYALVCQDARDKISESIPSDFSLFFQAQFNPPDDKWDKSYPFLCLAQEDLGGDVFRTSWYVVKSKNAEPCR
jgi:hypothetical protein